MKAIRNARVLVFILGILAMRIGFSSNENESDAYRGYVGDIIHDFANEMRSKYQMKCIGSGGIMPYGIEKISVYLASYEQHSIDTARDLEIKAVGKFLEIINSHKEIRPFLKEYPFGADRVFVNISFRKESGGFQFEESISSVSVVKNTVFYDRYNPKNEKLEELFKEPYEEAVKIVHGADSEK